uniref:Ycf1 n=1 Tax=Derbesia sp. WEST4838 TaxID=1847751 RepID=A0A1C9JBB9_9CHLO|nr:hypothetical protein [Derbesia sp. WEST4838]AOP19150.1 hypothetical protein [Derbesia sp. WEST4838]
MNLAQELKNYIYFLQHYIEQPNDLKSFINYIHYNLIYFIRLGKASLSYIFSLNWLHEFSSLPNLLPVYNHSTLREIYTNKNPGQFLIEYENLSFVIHTPIIAILIMAFFMSLYFWLPNSIIHILILRRLIVEGIPAGLAAALGTLTAQIFAISILLFGLRFSLYPWLNYESWNYIIGLIFICILIYHLAHSSIKRQRFTNYHSLGQIFCINFILVAFENYGLFPYFSSFSTVENLNCLTLTDPYQKCIFLICFIFSSFFWIGIFGYLSIAFSQVIVVYITKSYSNWIQKVNFSCLTLILAYCIASLPYYGLDYLILAPFGFHGEEPSILTLQTNKKDVAKGRLGEYSAHSSIDTDITPYDRGRYSTGSEIELTFEDLNFQGEYIWRARIDRLASGSAGIVNKFMSKFLPKNPKELMITDSRNEIVEEESIENPNIYTSNSIFESLFNRFLNDYTAEVKDETLPESILDFEQFSAFSEVMKYGFDSFASLEELESDEFEEELGKKIKNKYYTNPVYQFLLKIDITNFLKRQPPKYSLNEQEEYNLFKQKTILMNYYNSLRDYTLLPYNEIFKDLFGETKSYANRVYNQQYKGTLKILRRLFLIDLKPNQSQTILKYDQLLFDSKEAFETSFHEELKKPTKRLKKRPKYIRETINKPFYLGWDDQSKQLNITNRYFSHDSLFETFNLSNSSKEDLNLVFTSWPYLVNPNELSSSQYMFQKFDQAQTDLQKDLFEYTEMGDYESHLIYETLPSIIRRIDLRNKDKALIPLKPTYGVSIPIRVERG